MRPNRLIGRGLPELGAASGVISRRMEASGEPAGCRLSQLVFDLGATRFNHRRGFRTVASATLPAARAQLNEDSVSFAWPLALKRSALRRVNAKPEELADDFEDLVEEIENDGKWHATVSVHRAEDGKFVSLLVRAPIFAPVEDEEDGVPGYGALLTRTPRSLRPT